MDPSIKIMGQTLQSVCMRVCVFVFSTGIMWGRDEEDVSVSGQCWSGWGCWETRGHQEETRRKSVNIFKLQIVIFTIKQEHSLFSCKNGKPRHLTDVTSLRGCSFFKGHWLCINLLLVAVTFIGHLIIHCHDTTTFPAAISLESSLLLEVFY